MSITFLVFLVGVLLGVPIAFAMGFAGGMFLLADGRMPLDVMPTIMFGGMESFTLLAIPFFIMVGEIMARSGMLKVMIDFAKAVMGSLPGGLAHVNIGSSMLFGGVTGVSLADAAVIGRSLVPSMVEAGYRPGFAAALTAASSVMGAIIPPSVGMLIIAYIYGGNISVAKLFLAGATPGLLIGLSMMAIVAVMAKSQGFPAGEQSWSLRYILTCGRKALWGLVIPVLVIGGIVSGWFTATEAGAIAVAYSLVVGLVVLRTLSFRDIADALLASAKMSGLIYIMLGAAKLFAWLLVLNMIPQSIGNWMGGVVSSPQMFLIIVMLVFILAGFFIEGIASMIIFIPVVAPMAPLFGVEPHHLAMIIIMAVQISLFTPPVALGLFVVIPFAGCTMKEASTEVIPFGLAIVAITLLIIFVPAVAMWLPTAMGL